MYSLNAWDIWFLETFIGISKEIEKYFKVTTNGIVGGEGTISVELVLTLVFLVAGVTYRLPLYIGSVVVCTSSS